ncbi:MAG: hypothetical protein ACREXY_21940 [Gammaproteobacteria bacterium]
MRKPCVTVKRTLTTLRQSGQGGILLSLECFDKEIANFGGDRDAISPREPANGLVKRAFKDDVDSGVPSGHYCTPFSKVL